MIVNSEDGTEIAFDRLGEGPPLLVVGGLLCDRKKTRELCEELARRFSVISYDRRGRGESGNTAPYAVEREVEDLAALVEAAGGRAAVYGHSSGAGLALHAAARGLPITKLVLHEPPYGGDDAESQGHARELAERVRTAIAEARRADALRAFFEGAGMPEEVIAALTVDPSLLAMAPTMVHDFEVMGDFTGGAIPRDLVRSVKVPALVLAGGASPDFFRDAAERLAELLPQARHVVIEGADHAAPAALVAPLVAEFVEGRDRVASS